jgi:hypothetical protein
MISYICEHSIPQLSDEQWPNETEEHQMLAQNLSGKPIVLSQTACISPQCDYNVSSQK